MKRLYYIFIALCVFLVNSCGSDDHQGTNMDPVTDVSADPFIGSVILKFKAPTVEQYYYTLITYKDSEGNTKHQKVSSFNRDASGFSTITIGGFTDTETHNFELQTCSYDGGISETVTASAAPQAMAAAKDYVLKTVSMTASEESAKIEWTNLSGVAVNLKINYKDEDGVEKNLVVNAQKSGSQVIDIYQDTEFTISAENVHDQSTSESKKIVIKPLPSPYDNVQQGISYVPIWATGNNVRVTHNTETGPHDYTIETLGGDPYGWTDYLPEAIAGKRLIFRYKATADFTFEIFWCDKSGGPTGGRSSVVKMKASSRWRTFSHDYTSEIERHHWTGVARDYFRLDIGDDAGLTVHIRNMHFE